MGCQDKQKVCRTAVGLRRDDGQPLTDRGLPVPNRLRMW
jgi:hypothetical protein